MERKSEVKGLNNSIGMFDIYKGYGMLLIVIYHVTTLCDISIGNEALTGAWKVFKMIFSPLFAGMLPGLFIVTGYGLRKRKPAKYAKQQLKTLLKPYCIVTVLVTAITAVVKFYFTHSFRTTLKETLQVFLGFLLGFADTTDVYGIRIYPCGPMWFLIAMAVAGTIFNWLLNHFEGKKLTVAVVAVTCLGILLMNVEDYIPFSFARSLMIVSAMYIGYSAKRKKKVLDVINKWDIICLLCFYVLWWFCDEKVNIAWLNFMVGLMAGVIILKLSLKLNQFDNKLVAVLANVGRYSFLILCVHSVEMMGLPWYLFAEKVYPNTMLGLLIQVVIRVCIVFGTTYFINKYVIHGKFKLIGRKE